MSVLHRAARSAFSILAATALLAGCKEDTIIRTDVVPDSDLINTTTVDVPMTARSTTRDSAITALVQVGNDLLNTAQPLGAVTTDAFAGRTYAGIYFSVAPPAGFRADSAGFQLDSAVLILPYAGFTWGDTSSSSPAQRFNVYRITDSMTPRTGYFSNRRAAIDRSRVLGTATVYRSDYGLPRTIAGVIRPAHLRITLDPAYVRTLLQDNAGSLGSAAAFQNIFRGFYIEPDRAQAASALAYFRFGATTTGLYDRPAMLLHYGTAARDSAVVQFPFSIDSCAVYAGVDRQYGGSPAFDLLTGDNPAPKVLLLQNDPGAVIEARITGLNALQKQAVYQRAQIIITALDTLDAGRFFAPSRLYVVGLNSDGSTYNIADRLPIASTEPLDFIDGRVRTVTIGGVTVRQYVLNIPRELGRAVAQGKDELTLRIVGATQYPAAYRLIAGGSGHGFGIRTVVSYSQR